MTIVMAPAQTRRIPLWAKLFVTLFAAVLVPVYWREYGPTNFLWFCDAGLLLTVVALWTESRLLISMNALALTIPQTIWAIDFVSGGHVLGIARYMFDSNIPLFTRVLSTFHLWLPVLLIWLTRRVGYDRRALPWQTGLVTLLLVLSYLFTDPRHPMAGYPSVAVNVNRVYGPGITDVQTRMPPLAYLGLEILFFTVCFYFPTHLLFRKIFARPRNGNVE